MKALIITGTPGTGKTFLANQLAKKLKHPCIHLNELIKNNKALHQGKDPDGTIVVNEARLLRVLKQLLAHLKVPPIIEGHLAHILPKQMVICCIVTTCDLKILKARLQSRHYNQQKMRQNLDAEILQTCLIEAKQRNHRIIVLDTTNIKHFPDAALKRVKKYLHHDRHR
jgi:adenylate kinase